MLEKNNPQCECCIDKQAEVAKNDKDSKVSLRYVVE